MSSMKTGSLVVALAVMMAMPLRADAVMVHLSVEHLAVNADMAVRGTVQSLSSHWSADGRIIYTSAQVKVTQTIRGQNPGDTVTVEYEGGTRDGRTYRVSDAPQLSEGEELILFLSPAASYGGGEATVYRIHGYAQGAFSISGGQAGRSGFTALSGGKEGFSTGDSQSLQRLIERIHNAGQGK